MTGPVVCLVQARMGATRLPGKMMADLGGYPVLRWVLERVRRARRIDWVVLATTRGREDDVLVDLAARLGVAAFRGAADDVLGRFAAATQRHGAGTVVRVCADNPLVAPEVVDTAVQAFLQEAPDYAYNHVPRMGCEYPDGFGAEVLGAELLFHMARVSTDPIEREHVTTYIWNRLENHRVLVVPCPAEWKAHGEPIRLDVDRPQDLDGMRRLCRGLDFTASASEVLERWRHLNGAHAAAVGS